MFKKYTFILSILFISTNLTATEIHVAKDGTNALTGRGSEMAPYKTTSYIFSNNLIAEGDKILIHAGFYRETISVNVNNITIEPFGNDKVVISGANWYGENSWVADPTRPGVFKLTLDTNQVETDFTQLFVNHRHQQIARFPNNSTDYNEYISGSHKEMMEPRNQSSGFAVLLEGSKPAGVNQTCQVKFSDHNGTSILPNVTFSDEAIVRGFTGKLRNNIFSYSQDGGEVTRAADRLVTFKSFNTQGNKWGLDDVVDLPEGFGYVMDLSLLDEEGEWFYKKSENTVYYKPEGGIITGKNYELKRRQYVMKIEANNVTINNIDMRCGEVDIKNSENTSFNKCLFTYMTPYIYRRTYGVLRQGIVLNNSNSSTFESCYIGHTWGSGIIILKGSDDTTINNCIIEEIGWMGQFTVALENNGNNTHVTHNTFGKSSRFHIRTTESVYTEITDNDFDRAMAMGEDAGAIMFTSTGKDDALNMQGTIIAYNKIHGLKGIPAYDPQDWSNKKYMVSFYLEDVDNYTVHHNLIYDNNDEYTSVRLQNDGTPETTRNLNYFAYLGPRDRKLNRKIEYFNNTAWDYNQLIGFWHRTDNADVNAMDLKNNLFLEGAPSNVGTVSETDLQDFVTKAASEYGYNIFEENNEFVSIANDHYVDVSNDNFRLVPESTFNSGGSIIAGITSEANPAIGAWEGNTESLKNRVFSAGSDCTSSCFDGSSGLSVNDISINKPKIFPNPFQSALTIRLTQNVSNSSIKLYNSNGQLVISKATTDKEFTLQLNSLSPGVYYIQIKSDNNTFVEKVIKN